MDLYLGELYAPLMELFTDERINALCRYVEERRNIPAGKTPAAGAPETRELPDFLREPVLDFIGAAKKHLKGAGFDPFVAEGEYASLEPERISENLAACIGRLVLLEGPPGRAGSAGEKSAGPAPWLSGQDGCVFALAYGILSLLRGILGAGASGAEARALADHWRLDRKLREAWGGPGGDRACRITEIMKTVLSRTSPVDAASYRAAATPELWARAIILENYDAEDFRALVGLNFFDDIAWFNKEAFEELLFFAAFFLSLEGPEAFMTAKPAKAGDPPAIPAEAPAGAEWRKRAALIAQTAKLFSKAEAASAYRLDRLAGIVLGDDPGPASGKAGKKSPGKKRS
jgi:hypothetical protein